MNTTKRTVANMRTAMLKLAAQVGNERKRVHIASSLSIVEILAVLFSKTMGANDYFILSKGHAGLAYYVALKEAGIITDEQLETFEHDGGNFPVHPIKNMENHVVFAGGSLGMGLSYACGYALAAKFENTGTKIFVLVGDGELNEGSNWESVMLAKQYALGNLVVIVDRNNMQSDGFADGIIKVDFERVFNAFGWNVQNCDGHSTDELEKALNRVKIDAPNVIIADTIKGKGVSFMENNIIWHYNLLSEAQATDAIKEVGLHHE